MCKIHKKYVKQEDIASGNDRVPLCLDKLIGRSYAPRLKSEEFELTSVSNH